MGYRAGMPIELISLLLLGCPSSAPEPPAPRAEPAPDAASPAEPADSRFVPPPPADGLEPVTLVGHGLRIRIHPPFQVAAKADVFGGADDRDPPSDDLIVSWWNVAEANVGARRGLYHSFVVAAPVPDGPAPIQEIRHLKPDGSEVVRYRLGDAGSYVELAPQLRGAGGMLTVEPGPKDPRWAVEADGTRTPLVRRKILHSADPSVGPGFEQTGPQKPWGPWP